MEKEYMAAFIFILLCALADIRNKKIPLLLILIFGAVALLFLAAGNGMGWKEALKALIPGAAMLLLGLCTRESIGYGDGLAVLVLGLFTGTAHCLAAVFAGFLLSAAVSVLLLSLKKATGKSRLPFMPFLAMGLGIAVFGGL